MGQFEEYHLGHLLWATREPNGLNKLREAALELYSNKNIQKELTLEFIKQVHKSAFPFEDHLRLATDYVLSGDERMFGRITKVKETNWISNRSVAIKQLVNSEGYPWGLKEISPNTYEISTTWTLKEKFAFYPKILAQYNKNMLEAESPQEKIGLIAQHIQDIECLHFFQDGNCRMVYLLLNKELMKHGLDPVILLDPNNFDQMPPDDLYEQIMQGQKAFKHYIEKDLPYGDCLDQETIARNIQSLDPADFQIFGNNNLNYTKFLKFTEELLIIFNDSILKSSISEVTSFQTLGPIWNSVMLALGAYEFIKIHKNSELSCEKFYGSKNCNNYVKYLRENEEKTLASPKMKDVVNYFELLNYEHVKNYIFSHTNLKIDRFDVKTVIETIRGYLEGLSTLSAKYVSEYTIESLSDPLKCHLTPKEIVKLHDVCIDPEPTVFFPHPGNDIAAELYLLGLSGENEEKGEAD